jgi:hypothetical protein
MKIHQRTLGEMFRLADQEGKTPLEIAELLTGNTTFVRGKSWTRQNVDALLRNEDVCGNERLGYPTVVARDVFDRVQARLKAREGGRKGEMTPNLFRGKVFCECGSKAKLKNPGGKKTPGRSYFYCVAAGCNLPKHPYKEVERAVLYWMGAVEEHDQFSTAIAPGIAGMVEAVNAIDQHHLKLAEHKAKARLGPDERQRLEKVRQQLTDERSKDVMRVTLLKHTPVQLPYQEMQEDESEPFLVRNVVLYGDEEMQAEAKARAEKPSLLYTKDGGIVLHYHVKDLSYFGKQF